MVAPTQTTTMQTIAAGILLLSFLHLAMPVSASGPSECSGQARTCTCLYDEEGVEVGSLQADTDRRTVGLAAATGVLGGILATGAALTTYFHFRGGGAGGAGGGGVPGGKTGDRWRGQSRGSTSSGGSGNSQSPLTKRDKGQYQSRFRPTTGASTSGSATNVYRHSKVWPSHF